MEFLRVSHINKSYKDTFVLKDINLLVSKGERIAISGETGSGKTTLLKTIGGWIQPDEGSVIFNGERVKGPGEQLFPGHPRMAYLSQHFELRNKYRVIEELDYARKFSSEKAAQIFRICRIDHLLQRYTNELSGGERQRIAAAKALIGGAEIFLLDEPFSNLDQHHLIWMQELIESVSRELHITTLLVDHEPDHILPWADRIIVLKAGTIEQTGSPVDIYRNPVNEYVAGLFGRFSVAPPEWRKGGDRNRFLMYRPEQLTFHRRDAGDVGLKGEILSIRYYGSHNEVSVDVNGQIIRVRIPVDVTVSRKGVIVYPKK
jgi:iron(III) transport system ATP-binding protein